MVLEQQVTQECLTALLKKKGYFTEPGLHRFISLNLRASADELLTQSTV